MAFVFDKELCVALWKHFGGHSIGQLAISKGDRCDEFFRGMFFEELFSRRSAEYREEPWNIMASFINEKIYSKYHGRNVDNTYDQDGEVYIMGFDFNESRPFLRVVAIQKMERGLVNVRVDANDLKRIGGGGYLLYGYDFDNRRFGAILGLKGINFETGYLNATGTFFPID